MGSTLYDQLGGQAAMLAAIGRSTGTVKTAYEIFRDAKYPTLAYTTFHTWLKKDKALGEALVEARALHRNTKKVTARMQARKRYSAGLDNRRKDVEIDTLEQEIVACEGDLEKAAKVLGTSVLDLMRRAKEDAKVRQAIDEGRALRHLRIEQDLYDAATGATELDADRMRACVLIARTKMGWKQDAEKDVVRTYDPSSVPGKDPEVGRPR